MFQLMRVLGWIVVFITLGACGKVHKETPDQPPGQFVAGKDYQIIARSPIVPEFGPKSVVNVKEFFNYACPACYHFEPSLEKWVANKPVYVQFERIPVIFNSSWRSLARAFYIAKMLGVEKKLTPLLFKAIHEEKKDVSGPQQQKDFFVAQGVKASDYDSIASFSPGIDAQLLRSDTLMENDKIDAAPTLVIDNRFKVDPSLVNGDQKRFLQVIDYLIEKVRKGGD